MLLRDVVVDVLWSSQFLPEWVDEANQYLVCTFDREERPAAVEREVDYAE